MIKYILLISLVIFFAMNMGASGIAPSFAAVYGGRLIKKRGALVLFSIFVFLGAYLCGRNVSLTLGKGLLPHLLINFEVLFIILVSATVSLFAANILKIPQSTSHVTVAALVGAGLYFQQLNLRVLLFKILPLWIILPLLSYILTFYLYGIIYPPKHNNLHLYQKLFARHDRLRLTSLISGCYVAFAIGTNNVANAAGPLYGAGLVNIIPGLLMLAPLFGLGAWLMGKGPLETAGKEIVPLGLVSGSLVSCVTATLLILASIVGIPQSLVQLNLASIFAISSLKNGHKYTWDRHITQKTFIVWVISPLLSLTISYLLLRLFFSR